MEQEVKYKISFDQSVSTGIIGFHGAIEFTDYQSLDDPIFKSRLMKMIKEQEQIFRDNNYKVASDIVPKEKKEISK